MKNDLSILLIVRDWSTSRLALSLQSLLAARSALRAEVILLDYGSKDPVPYQSLAETYEARYVRAEADVWARSRAVNMAAASATGDWLLFADADMLWSMQSLKRSLELVQQDENQFLVFQARDLPSGYNGDALTEHGYTWDDLERQSAWRPRWGMGMQLVSAQKFSQVQGLDERMTVWGAEDADMARRLRAVGLKQHWVNDPEVRVYHIWHEDSKDAAKSSTAGSEALRRNRQILYEDSSVVRNVPGWGVRQDDALPLVSVVIVTRDRRLYLQQSIDSVLCQSFQDFEVVIVDDGKDAGVLELIAQYDDSRIRYYKSRKPGVAAGRNFGAEVSRGHYTAIHDDDDIMLPWSLEVRLKAIEAGHVGSYGGFWNFADDDGELTLVPGKRWSLKAVYSGKTVGHPTMLLETRAVRSIGYDEGIEAGSDYKFRVQLAVAGYILSHCADVVTLRRMHSHNMSVVDLSTQRGTSDLVNAVLRFNMSSPERQLLRGSTRDKDVEVYDIPEELIQKSRVRAFLPEHLVSRIGFIRHSAGTSVKNALPDGCFAITFNIVNSAGSTQFSMIPDISPRQSNELESQYRDDYVLRSVEKIPNTGGQSLTAKVEALLEIHEEKIDEDEKPYVYTWTTEDKASLTLRSHSLDQFIKLTQKGDYEGEFIHSPSKGDSTFGQIVREGTV